MHAVIVRPRLVGAMVVRAGVLSAVVVRRRGVCGRAGSRRRMSRMRIVGGLVCRLIDVRTVSMRTALPSDPIVGVTPRPDGFHGMTAIAVDRRAIAD